MLTLVVPFVLFVGESVALALRSAARTVSTVALLSADDWGGRSCEVEDGEKKYKKRDSFHSRSIKRAG